MLQSISPLCRTNLQHHQRPVPLIPYLYGVVGHRSLESVKMWFRAFSWTFHTTYHHHDTTEILLVWYKITKQQEEQILLERILKFGVVRLQCRFIWRLLQNCHYKKYCPDSKLTGNTWETIFGGFNITCCLIVYFSFLLKHLNNIIPRPSCMCLWTWHQIFYYTYRRTFVAMLSVVRNLLRVHLEGLRIFS